MLSTSGADRVRAVDGLDDVVAVGRGVRVLADLVEGEVGAGGGAAVLAGRVRAAAQGGGGDVGAVAGHRVGDVGVPGGDVVAVGHVVGLDRDGEVPVGEVDAAVEDGDQDAAAVAGVHALAGPHLIGQDHRARQVVVGREALLGRLEAHDPVPGGEPLDLVERDPGQVEAVGVPAGQGGHEEARVQGDAPGLELVAPRLGELLLDVEGAAQHVAGRGVEPVGLEGGRAPVGGQLPEGALQLELDRGTAEAGRCGGALLGGGDPREGGAGERGD